MKQNLDEDEDDDDSDEVDVYGDENVAVKKRMTMIILVTIREEGKRQ